MYTGQVAVISNRGTWHSEVVELVDEDDGTTTDLTSPDLTVDITVTIEDIDRCGRIYATATLANGKALIPGPGFQWFFQVADLQCLCPGSYRLRVIVTINNFVSDFIDGSIAVVEGN